MVLDHWRQTNATGPILAFARITALWDTPFVALEPSERDARDKTEPPTLLGTLIEGMRFAGTVSGALNEERDALALTERAARALKTLKAFVNTIVSEATGPITGTPLDTRGVGYKEEIEKIDEGLSALDLLIRVRATRAVKAHERFEVSREVGSKASDKSKSRLDGATRFPLTILLRSRARIWCWIRLTLKIRRWRPSL
jgi:hypothetical protein